MQKTRSATRLPYLDSLKYIFCLMIFWTHFTGVFWTMCEVKPDLRVELQALFHPPFSILVDSNLALYGFCILSGYLAAHKKIHSFKSLLIQILNRYIRFVIPFFFINLIAFITYFTLGFPTQLSSQLLHNTWIGTYYNHAPTVHELIKATLTMSGDLNGPLWMMKYIFGGTCLIFVYNYIRLILEKSGNVLAKGFIKGYDFMCLTAVFLTFTNLPEPNFFHLLLVLFGVILMRADDAFKEHLNVVHGGASAKTYSAYEIGFFLMAIIPVFLDAGGLNRIVYPFFRDHVPSIANAFIWNPYWVMGFSFFLILGVMNCKLLQKLLSGKLLQTLAPTNFSVYLVHFPLISCFSLKLYILMVNRISYSKEFIVISIATFTALFIVSYLYEKTIGKLQNKLIKMCTINNL